LTCGQAGEDLLLHGWKSRLAANEALVACNQASQRFVGGV
jgi:hypothetical protein